MPHALEVVSGFVTAPGATFTAWTMAAGNSAQVRSANINAKVGLVNMWAMNQAVGDLRVRSPRLHDVNMGIRARISVGNSGPRYPGQIVQGFFQPLIPQDVLIIEHTGTATAGKIETGSILIYYDDLPGVAARLIDAPTLQRFGRNTMGQYFTLTTGITGGYSGAVAVNAAADNWKANTDYALIGAVVDTRVGTIRVTGVDSGNIGVGIPGEPTMQDLTSEWFSSLSFAFGLPLIPVFNSANKFNIFVDATGNDTAITTYGTLWFVELAAGSVPGSTQP
jgi:hypothetical protein